MKKWIVAIVLLLICCVLPFVSNPYYNQILFYIFIFAGVGLGWNLVGGYAGQISLGHAMFFGIGAYCYALLAPHIGVWPAVIVGGVIAAISAAPIGAICFRLRGPYFSLATIAVAQLLNVLATNQLKNWTQGSAGLLVPNIVKDPASYYWIGLGFLVVSFVIVTWIATGKTGYYLMAIREDEDTAQTITVNTPRYKLYSLVISALITGIGGVVYAANLGSIQPNDVFGGAISNQVVFLAILGGAGTIYGPLVGAFILEFASDYLKNSVSQLSFIGDPNAFAFFVYGLLIVLVVMFMPAGIVGTLSNWWKRRVSNGVRVNNSVTRV